MNMCADVVMFSMCFGLPCFSAFGKPTPNPRMSVMKIILVHQRQYQTSLQMDPMWNVMDISLALAQKLKEMAHLFAAMDHLVAIMLI